VPIKLRSSNLEESQHNFSPLGKLARRVIYFADVFFFIFYFFSWSTSEPRWLRT